MNAIIHDLLAAAKEDHVSVIQLTRDLVTIPSRGGVDPYDPVLGRVTTWLTSRHLPATVLKDKTDAIVGLMRNWRVAARPPVGARRLPGHRALRRSAIASREQLNHPVAKRSRPPLRRRVLVSQ